MNNHINLNTLINLFLILILMQGCVRHEQESRHKTDIEYKPIKVELPKNMSKLYQDLGFEYSSIEDAERKIVAELDSIYESENGYFIHRMHNEKFIMLNNNDPRAFEHDFSLMQERGYVNVEESDDKKLRMYYWDTGEGGTMIDWGNICQFESDGEIYVYNGCIYDVTNTEADEFSIGCSINALHTIKADNGETYYLVDTYIRESSNYGFQEIYPIKISNGKLVPTKIFEMDPDNEYNNSTAREYFISDWYFKTAGEGWDWLYCFDKDNQTLYVPEVIDCRLTDRYNLYKFSGTKFDYIGDDGGFWLHPTIRDYKQLELLFCTEDYRIRIDIMNDNTYRYSSWRKSMSMSEHPDLIILNGSYNEDDGNYYFENNEYTYCIEPDTNNSQLTVCHGYNLIMQQKQIIAY